MLFRSASAYAWSHTAAPMLSGTLITAVGFMPNGFARSTAGEYTSNMFWIVGIALIASWVVAVVFTPYLGVKLLPDIKKTHSSHTALTTALYDTPRYNRFRQLLGRVIARKWVDAGNLAYPGAPLVIGRNDERMLSDPVLNLSAHSGFPVTSPPADSLVAEGDILEIAGFQWEVLDIPGHSPGHVVFLQRFPTGQVAVFGGDVLFRGSIGRTDFPGGDHEALIRGIRRKLFTLPEDTVVYPGHGPVTTVAREMRSNPFCGLE